MDKSIAQNNFSNKARFDVTATSPDKKKFKFTLVKSNKKAKKSQQSLWGVYFAKGTEKDVQQTEKGQDNTTKLIPVRAIVNAKGKVPKGIKNEKLKKRYYANSGWVDGYQGACTGDYDLFAILSLAPGKIKPKRLKGIIPFEKKGIDIRPVKLGIKKNEKKLLAGEHPDYGNMTARIYIIRDNLNEGFQKVDSWTDRLMVHHSDEGGRPFWPEIDYPLHAFLPLSDDKRHYAIEDKKDLVVFFRDTYKLGYKIVIPPNWEEELGRALKKENVPYEVPTWTKKTRKRADLVRAKSISGAFSNPRLRKVPSSRHPGKSQTGNRLLDLERVLQGGR
ncbi:MAG: hypothetical protein AAFV72_18560 [Cyanobacteria bacterium J06635_1]